MTNVITSCQIQRLAALQQELSPMGMTIAITCGPAPTAAAAAPKKRRKYTRRTVSTADTTSADTVSVTLAQSAADASKKQNKKTRKMTSVGTAAIKQASTQYHADIRELRSTEGLTLKQARERYQVLKTEVPT